jgi:membrane-associated phospholipid phosphatase
MTLPIFIHKNNRVMMAFVCGIAFFFGYSIPNHFHLFAPQMLPLTPLDRAIPLVPWTIFIYTSEYWLFISAYFIFRDELTRNKYIWSYFGVLAFGAVFFVFLPTTYPRSEYPLVGDPSAFTYRVFQALRNADDPSNCFPSMHVTCCYLTAFAFLERPESRRNFWIYFIWASLIALSTLPTKQHYIVDVVGGVMLSLSGYWVFFRKMRYVPMSEYINKFHLLRLIRDYLTISLE